MLKVTDYQYLIYLCIGLLFLIYFSSINLLYAIFSILGMSAALREKKEVDNEDLSRVICSNSLPPLSFLIASYNEKQNIIECVDNLVDLSYPIAEIVVVNDGSTDNTLKMMIDRYALKSCPIFFKKELPTKEIRAVYRSLEFPNLIVIDKENGGRHDALNAGIGACTSSHVITMDPDTVIDDTQMGTIIPAAFSNPDTIAIGAGVRIKNGCKSYYHNIATVNFPESYFVGMEALEYMRSFLVRCGLNYVNGNFCISGAFTILSKEALLKIQGYGPTFANDMEVIIRLHRYYIEKKIPYAITYLSEPVAYTVVPDSYALLHRQRFLWHRGLLESLWFHTGLFFSSDHGTFGKWVMPLTFYAEAIEPVVELLGYIYVIIGWYLGILTLTNVLLIIGIAWCISFIFSLFCLLVEELTFRKYRSWKSTFKLIGYAAIEIFGYRQLTILWRIHGFLGFFWRYFALKRDYKNFNFYFK